MTVDKARPGKRIFFGHAYRLAAEDSRPRLIAPQPLLLQRRIRLQARSAFDENDADAANHQNSANDDMQR